MGGKGAGVIRFLPTCRVFLDRFLANIDTLPGLLYLENLIKDRLYSFDIWRRSKAGNAGACKAFTDGSSPPGASKRAWLSSNFENHAFLFSIIAEEQGSSVVDSSPLLPRLCPSAASSFHLP